MDLCISMVRFSIENDIFTPGYFAYVESSNKDPGSRGIFTSPTYTKAEAASGGCVQLHYHMFGADIGTLNVSVYDNTESGLVANFQRTGL